MWQYDVDADSVTPVTIDNVTLVIILNYIVGIKHFTNVIF